MMSTRLLRGAGAAVLFASLVCAQAGPDGHWEGSYTVNNREIGISLDLAKNAKSEWIASMGMPSERATGLVVMDVAVNGKSVKFVAVELMMAQVDLTLGDDRSMKGTITTRQGRPLPVEFKRTGEAKVELIPASPAVSKELEGDWEGLLQMPGHAFPMIFHFRNQPDKTVAATIVSPDVSDRAGPLNDIKQTGQKVEFGIKIAQGSTFQGTLNPEGTEIAGQFTHGESSVPMTLRKK